MGRYDGPATVEWTDGTVARELAVECRAESRSGEPYGTEVWDGDLTDTLGVLSRLAGSPHTVYLRTPFGVSEIVLSQKVTRTHGEFGASRTASAFTGQGEAPF